MSPTLVEPAQPLIQVADPRVLSDAALEELWDLEPQPARTIFDLGAARYKDAFEPVLITHRPHSVECIGFDQGIRMPDRSVVWFARLDEETLRAPLLLRRYEELLCRDYGADFISSALCAPGRLSLLLTRTTPGRYGPQMIPLSPP